MLPGGMDMKNKLSSVIMAADMFVFLNLLDTSAVSSISLGSILIFAKLRDTPTARLLYKM